MAEYEMTHTGAELDEAIGKVLDGYKDVSIVTARAGDVVQGKNIVTTEGTVAGTLALPSGTITITENDFVDVSAYAEAMVAVPDEDKIASNLSLCRVYPSTSGQVIRPTAPYDGFGMVRVGAVPGATQATPSISVNGSTGLITASAEQSAGLVEAGTKTATEQLPTQAAAEITPTTSQQTAVAAGKFTLGDVVVKPIPSEYVVPSGSLSITENDTYDVTDKASVAVNVQPEELAAFESGTLSSYATGSLSWTLDHPSVPTKFCLVLASRLTSMASGYTYVASVAYDGTNVTGSAFSSSGAQVVTFSQSYDSGTNKLTISASGYNVRFGAGTYKLMYTYEA